jgi:hypothetical protein
VPNQQQLAGMRARYRARLPRTCTVPGVPRTTTIQDESSGVGGTVQESYGTPVSGLRCSFHGMGGGPRAVEGSLTEIISHEVRFEWAAVLKAGMEIVVDAAADDGVRRFLLVSPLSQPYPVGRRWSAKEL